LILEVSRLLKYLVVVNAKYGDIDGRIEDQAAILRTEVAGPRVTHDGIGSEAMKFGQVHPDRHTVDLGLTPGDGKGQRSAEEHVKVIGVSCVFPHVIRADHRPTADSLFEARVELISPTRVQRHGTEGADSIGR